MGTAISNTSWMGWNMARGKKNKRERKKKKIEVKIPVKAKQRAAEINKLKIQKSPLSFSLLAWTEGWGKFPVFVLRGVKSC